MEETVRKTETFNITTDYDSYRAVVTVYSSGRKHIVVHKRPPSDSWFYKTFGPDPEFIGEVKAGKYADWGAKIKSIIYDYEEALYQADKLKESGGYLYIDYEAEAQKRRPRPKQQEQQEEVMSLKPKTDIEVHDWQNPGKPETIHRSGQVQTNSGKPMHINSLLNLPQYRHLKNIK